MKKITNSLTPLAVLVFFGACMISVFGLLVILMTSVGFANGLPLAYFQRLDVAVISVALPIVGMILFAAILLGLPRKPATAVIQSWP
jgi:TRAP-type C4-dicarboxylate transport system permease small subunit